MRNTTPAAFCAIALLGLATNACSLLGTYANSAGSMMSQPGGAGTPSATPGASGAPSSSTTPPTSGSDKKSEEAKPATPSTVSVSLKNGCSDTVKLFFGDKPKFGSGRYSSLGSNTRTNQTFKPGDMLWIVDDGQNGVSSVTIEAGMREVEVTSGCDDFRTK